MIKKLQLKNFTAFDDLTVEFSPGINILLGENGTGKTHLMKVLYDACKVSHPENMSGFKTELISDFSPLNKLINRLVRRSRGNKTASIKVFSNKPTESTLTATITTLNKVVITGEKKWKEGKTIGATYIPVKDMLANGASFAAMADTYKVSIEGIYIDIIKKALIPTKLGPRGDKRNRLLKTLEENMSGRVVEKEGVFFLINRSGRLEFTLLAEGYRKLGLLWTLIQNGSLTEDSVLFWDEPEANLNPKLARSVVDVLVQLQLMGVQIFIATHNYVFLKEFELATDNGDGIRYHSLFKGSDGEIECASTDDFYQIEHNPIDAAYVSILDREITKKLDL